MKNRLGNFFPFTMGTGTGDDAETQEEKEDDDEHFDFGSQVSLNSSTQGNDAYTNKETASMDRLGKVKKLCDHDEFGNANWEEQKQRAMKPLCGSKMDHEETSRQRIKTRVSTSTKLLEPIG